MYTFQFGVCFVVVTRLCFKTKKALLLARHMMLIARFSQHAPRHRCQTHLLTCDRCLRYSVQRPDLVQLENGPHFMTAVRAHVDHFHDKCEQWQNPKASDRVYAWAYSSGHCRISVQVSLWIAYCNLTVNWHCWKKDGTRVWWSDGRFKHLTNPSVWFSHYWWVWPSHSRDSGFSPAQRKSGVG